MKPFFLA